MSCDLPTGRKVESVEVEFGSLLSESTPFGSNSLHTNTYTRGTSTFTCTVSDYTIMHDVF